MSETFLLTATELRDMIRKAQVEAWDHGWMHATDTPGDPGDLGDNPYLSRAK